MGQLALREAGLFDEFLEHSRPEGQATKLMRFDGHVYWDDAELDPGVLKTARGDENVKPEIDREALRGLLLGSLEPERVRWGCKVQNVELMAGAEDKSLICFADGSMQADVDLVVGADGAWSKVRPLVTDVWPFYSGITAVTLWCGDVNGTNPRLATFVGEGSVFMFDEGRAIIVQRQGGDRIRTYACLRKPQGWKESCGIDWTDGDAARKTLVDGYFADCSENLRHAILSSTDNLQVAEMNMLPVGHSWEHRPGVTLVGDSAHLMTPFAGVGCNVAMLDALMLARALASRKDCLGDAREVSRAVREYEEEMFRVAKVNAEKTFKGLVGHFSAEGARSRAEMFRGVYEKYGDERVDEATFN